MSKCIFYNAPIWYGKYRIYHNTIGFGGKWHFSHDDYDGAPDSNDNRAGEGDTVEECLEQIQEQIDEAFLANN